MAKEANVSAKTTLAVLLGADRGKLKLVPKKKVEIKRLSELVGEPVVFTIRALTGDEIQDAQDASMKITQKGGLENVDGSTLQCMTVLYGTLDPDLKSRELLEAYEAATPELLLRETNFLLPGEVAQLFNAIQELSGYGDGAVETVKN